MSINLENIENVVFVIENSQLQYYTGKHVDNLNVTNWTDHLRQAKQFDSYAAAESHMNIQHIRFCTVEEYILEK